MGPSSSDPTALVVSSALNIAHVITCVHYPVQSRLRDDISPGGGTVAACAGRKWVE